MSLKADARSLAVRTKLRQGSFNCLDCVDLNANEHGEHPVHAHARASAVRDDAGGCVRLQAWDRAGAHGVRRRGGAHVRDPVPHVRVRVGVIQPGAAPRQPAYTPNYPNPEAVTAALEGILGGTASAATPSVTAAVTEAVVTPASGHTNLHQRPQTRATVAITEARARVRGQGQNEGGEEKKGDGRFARAQISPSKAQLRRVSLRSITHRALRVNRGFRSGDEIDP